MQVTRRPRVGSLGEVTKFDEWAELVALRVSIPRCVLHHAGRDQPVPGSSEDSERTWVPSPSGSPTSHLRLLPGARLASRFCLQRGIVLDRYEDAILSLTLYPFAAQLRGLPSSYDRGAVTAGGARAGARDAVARRTRTSERAARDHREDRRAERRLRGRPLRAVVGAGDGKTDVADAHASATIFSRRWVTRSFDSLLRTAMA